MPWCTSRGQRTACRSLFPLPAGPGVLGSKSGGHSRQLVSLPIEPSCWPWFCFLNECRPLLISSFKYLKGLTSETVCTWWHIFLRLLTIGLTNWADTGLLRLSVSICINFGSWDILMNFLPYLYNQNPRPWDGTVCVMPFSMYRVSGDDHFILIWVFCVLIDFSLTPSLLT